MFIQTRNPVYSRTLSEAILGALDVNPAAALIVTPFLHLFTVGPAPITPDSVIADFTECTFVGYAPVAVTFPLLGPIKLADFVIAVERSLMFVGGAIVPPGENALGYWVDDAAVGGTNLYISEAFVGPAGFALPGDFLQLDLLFPFPMQQSLTI